MTDGWPEMARYSYVALRYMPLNALHCYMTFLLKSTSGSLWLFPKRMLNVYSSVYKLLISNEPNHRKTN